MRRVNLSVTARAEQAVLDRLVRLVPGFVSPDFLTAVAFTAAIGIGASYFYANQNKWLYIVAAALYAAH